MAKPTIESCFIFFLHLIGKKFKEYA